MKKAGGKIKKSISIDEDLCRELKDIALLRNGSSEFKQHHSISSLLNEAGAFFLRKNLFPLTKTGASK